MFPRRVRLTFARGKEINFYACSVAIHRGRSRRVVRLAHRCALRRVGCAPGGQASAGGAERAGVRCVAGSRHLRGCRQHHQERSFVPHSYASAFHRRRVACGEIARDGATGSSIQFRFLEWKKEFTLRKHWLAHNKTICPRDHVKFTRAHLGVRHRRSFYCQLCQRLYT